MTISQAIAPVIRFVGGLLGIVGGVLGIWTFCNAQKDRKSILEFVMIPVYTPADDDEESSIEFDGTRMVPAVRVTATNNGKRPITIECLHCMYRSHGHGAKYFETGTFSPIDKRLEQGGSCSADLKLGTKPMGVTRVWASDSAHTKEWPAPETKILQLNSAAITGNVWV